MNSTQSLTIAIPSSNNTRAADDEGDLSHSPPHALFVQVSPAEFERFFKDRKIRPYDGEGRVRVVLLSNQHEAAPAITPVERSLSEALTPYQRVKEQFESFQAENDPVMMKHFIKDLIVGEGHAHMDGFFGWPVVKALGMQCDEIRWNPEAKLFEKYVYGEANAEKLIPFQKIDAETLREIEHLVTLEDERKHPMRACMNFFRAFPIRESIINILGLAGLMSKMISYCQSLKIRYMELMAVLSYQRVPAQLIEIWDQVNHQKNGWDQYLAHPDVQLFIKNYVNDSQSTLDEAKERVNRACKAERKPEFDCYSVDHAEGVKEPVTIRITAEIMRDCANIGEFFTILAAVCELLEKDRRVVSFTICGPESDFNAVNNLEQQFKMIRYMQKRYGENIVRFNPHFCETSSGQVDSDYLTKAWEQLSKTPITRAGHATGVAKTAELVENNIPIEACLTSNLRTLCVKASENHSIRRYLRAGGTPLFCADDPGIFGKDVKDDLVTAALVYKNELSFERFLNCIRAYARYSHLRGDSLYTNKEFALREGFKNCGLPDWHPQPAQQEILARSEKARLELQYEQEIQRFITAKAHELTVGKPTSA